MGHGHPDPDHPKHLKGALDGGNIFWVSPTFSISKKIERDIVKATADTGWHYSKGEGRLEVPGGGAITLKTAASPNSLRGDGVDGVVCDEPAFFHDPACWSEALRPALSDLKGWSMFTTTPCGLNWVKDQFDLDGVDPNYKSWQLPSSDNPLMTQDELDSALLDVGPRAFAQEYDAQFVDMEGSEFSGYYFQMPDFWFDRWPDESDIRLRVVALDPSKGKTDKSDFSAFVMLALTHDGHVYVDAEVERMDVRRITEESFRINQMFKPDGFGVEINQFQELLQFNIDDLARKNGVIMPLHGINHSDNKITRIRATLTPHLSRGELHFKRGSRGTKKLVSQLQEFPIGKHDDGPDALEMGLTLLRKLIHG